MKTVSSVGTKPQGHYRGIRECADSGLHEQVADMATSLLSRGADILDFGAGQGALSKRLADLGFKVTAVDSHAADFRGGTAFETLDFNDPKAVEAFAAGQGGAFDMVLGVEVIEHLENPWAFVRALTAMARPGGYIVLSTPNVTSWSSRIRFLFTGRFHQFEDSDQAYGHINPVAEDELRLILQNCGLDVERIVPGGWLPRLWLRPSPRLLAANLFGFLLSFMMKGTWRGWCLVALARKPD